MSPLSLNDPVIVLMPQREQLDDVTAISYSQPHPSKHPPHPHPSLPQSQKTTGPSGYGRRRVQSRLKVRKLSQTPATEVSGVKVWWKDVPFSVSCCATGRGFTVAKTGTQFQTCTPGTVVVSRRVKELLGRTDHNTFSIPTMQAFSNTPPSTPPNPGN